ncbi:response regulator [Reinekea thalattae]|uniref:Sensory/regulatory protein RpfC n=1 Tax=Reinekea thalattae TaxID=2593301 RepID=A0A5C8ZAR3_9GAMM|nr:response regulator [Reinekea thalattae]TXR54369.1 response regulator [Reinekea thalattae]
MAQQKNISQILLKQTLPITLVIALGTSMVFGMGMIWAINTSADHAHQENLNQALSSYHQAIAAESSHLYSIASNPLTLQSLTNVQSLTKLHRNYNLSVLHATGPFTSSVSIYLKDGSLYSSTLNYSLENAPDIALTPWFNYVIGAQQTFIETTSNGLLIAAPIMQANELLGVIVSQTVNLKALINIHLNDYNLVILDRTERVLYSTNTELFPLYSTQLIRDNATWRKSMSLSEGDLTFVSFEKKSVHQKNLLLLYLLLFSGASFIFISAFVTAKIAGRVIREAITDFTLAIEHFEQHKQIGALTKKTYDISELRQLNERFQDLLTKLLASNLSKNRVSAILNSLNDLLVVFDLDGTPVISNRAFDDFFTNKEFSHKDIFSFLFNNFDSPKSLLNMTRPLPSFETTYQTGTQGGRQTNIVHWSRSPMFDEQGNIFGAIFVGQDITHSNELSTNIELKNAAIDAADSGILILENEAPFTRVCYANTAFERITGISSQLICNKDLSLKDFKQFANAPLARIRTAMIEKKSIVEVLKVPLKNNDQSHVELVLSPIPTDGLKQKSYYLCILKDVTQQQVNSNLLISAKEQAEQSARLKSEFLASMSHEIRTPMNGVIGMLDILHDTPLTMQQLNYVRIAQGSADALLSIINDILDFSKIEAGKVILDHADFNLYEMLDSFIDGMAQQAQRKGIELIIDTLKVQHHQVKGDAGRVRQILTNLVSNAIKFTEQGYVKIQVESTDLDDQLCTLLVSVSDTGKGIPADRQHSLFDPFIQVEAKDAVKGTGLGLAIVKQLVESMNGQIEVLSEVGQGSEFKFSIEIEATNPQPILSTDHISGKRILLVEDCEMTRQTITNQLSHWGASIVTIDSAEQAIDYIETQDDNIDLALISSEMKQMSGKALGVRLATTHPKATINQRVLMTPVSKDPNLAGISRAGFNSHITKPVKAKDLANLFNSTLNSSDAVSVNEPINDTNGEANMSKQQRILIVEDNTVNQMIARKFVETLGFEAVTVANGQEALDTLIAQSENPIDSHFDLILMDCQMPIMDGFEATDKIRQAAAGEMFKDIPIIAMTANAMKGDRERCIEVGMNDYTSKPLDKEDFLSTIQRNLRT